ncbi:MAG TPA: DUF4097 family beta strand repeat-containing protein [Ktedonobacterales bacterium]|nr:DUF4097 family beta strand repeat-containing protein [Ktedonobacterales bacterium]
MSSEQTVSGGGLTRVEIGRAEGELEVLGWDEPHIRIVGLDDDDDDDTDIPQIDPEGVLRLERLHDDVTISVPRGVSLYVLSAKGDTAVRGLLGNVRIDAASGDVDIQDANSLQLGAISGDLQIAGCMGDVRLNSVAGDLVARNLGSLEITGAVSGDTTVSEIVGEVSLKQSANGDAHFTNVGHVSVANMRGDCDVTRAGSVVISNLSGDLTVQEVEGFCHIQNMHGDAKLRRCGGLVTLDNVGGDLVGTDLRGGIATGNVAGDARLDTPLVKDATYTIHAAGDISLRIRGELHARFVAQTHGGTIQTRLPLTVERGRRRHLVGAIGRAEAVVTLQSDGGDITISAADSTQEGVMTDEYLFDESGDREEAGAGSGWGGQWRFGHRDFGFRWDKAPGGFTFATGYRDDPDGPGDPRVRRGGGKGKFPFEWDDAQRADYERRIREMSDRTAQAARKAAERATQYAERAAKRARETDWEAVGRDVRGAIERAMGEMEHLLEQFRTGPNTPPPPPNAPPPPPRPGSYAQRVPIEQDEQAAPRNKDELDAQRRAILEQLRSGALSMDEAERQLDALR